MLIDYKKAFDSSPLECIELNFNLKFSTSIVIIQWV